MADVGNYRSYDASGVELITGDIVAIKHTNTLMIVSQIHSENCVFLLTMDFERSSDRDLYDSSEVQLIERVPAEREVRLRHALRIAGIGVWEWDMISDKVVWDKRQFELFGKDEVDGMVPLSYANDVIHPDDLEHLNVAAQKVLHENASVSVEFRVVQPDKSVRWLLGCSSVVEFNGNKSEARLIGVNLDVTENKETELKLCNSEEKLRAANARLQRLLAERNAELSEETARHKITSPQKVLSEIRCNFCYKTFSATDRLFEGKDALVKICKACIKAASQATDGVSGWGHR